MWVEMSGRQRKGRRLKKEEGGKVRGDRKEEGTSILRPSTIVPFSFSRARSASALVSNVTNPKPCSGREVGLENKSDRGRKSRNKMMKPIGGGEEDTKHR